MDDTSMTRELLALLARTYGAIAAS